MPPSLSPAIGVSSTPDPRVRAPIRLRSRSPPATVRWGLSLPATHRPNAGARLPARARSTQNNFERIEQVGEGTYGMVYMARDKETGEIVVRELRSLPTEWG